ncbi:hypothetical protein C4579_04225 [Candidatus Microgenomates bacterium]|nr:MAG: hypothetical protein C4579_04225 [Candidatus Microgenomates bacterium]
MRRILSNSAIQLVGKVVTAGFGFLTTLILARVLGAEHFGVYTQVVSYIWLFFLLVDFGLNPLFIRETNDQAKFTSQAPSFVAVRLLLGFTAALLAVAGAWLLTLFFDQFTPLFWSASVVAILSIFGFTLQQNALAMLQRKLSFVAAIVLQVVAVITTFSITALLLITSLAPDTQVMVALTAFSAGLLLSGVISGWLVWHETRWRVHLNTKKLSYWLMMSAPLGLVLFINLLYFRIDVWILTMYRSTAELGAYALSYKFFEFAISLPTLSMQAAFPQLIQATGVVQKRIHRQLMISFFIVSLFVASGLFLGAPFLTLIKGEYSQAIVPLQILSLSVPIFFVTSPLMWDYIASGKQQKLLPIYALGLISNVVLNLLLIPQFGALAAAATTGLSELIILLAIIKFKS